MTRGGASMEAQGQETTVEQAAEDFAAELARWREVRGMSKRALALAMGFDPSYISHMESGRHKPSEEFARLADEALNAGKAIWRRWWARRILASGAWRGCFRNSVCRRLRPRSN